MEVWKDVIGYEGLYQVSDLGNVRGCERIIRHSNGGTAIKKQKLLKKSKHNQGYMLVSLCKNGVCKTTFVHVLVANAFIPNDDNKKEVNHKDFDKSNNTVCNLEWVSRDENILHFYAKYPDYYPNNDNRLKLCRGSLHGRSKINEDQAFQIKYKSKGKTLEELSIKFGINKMSISRIKRGITWTHI